MLVITIPSIEKFNEEKSEFIYTEEVELTLEHSLVSISKWESKWQKSFINTKDKTTEEVIDYVRCMCDHDISQEYLDNLTRGNIKDINDYINHPMTATKFYEDDNKQQSNRDVITSELIYYWMITLNIPMECQHWHLNRLLTLIRVCNVKNSPPKKMSKQEILSRNAALNAARKKQLNTKG